MNQEGEEGRREEGDEMARLPLRRLITVPARCCAAFPYLALTDSAVQPRSRRNDQGWYGHCTAEKGRYGGGTGGGRGGKSGKMGGEAGGERGAGVGGGGGKMRGGGGTERSGQPDGEDGPPPRAPSSPPTP